MKLAIHQPEFMPWMGFFYKMALADQYVILDHVQFKKRYFENRNQIVSNDGKVDYVRIPVVTKDKYIQSINEVAIDNSQRWKEKLLNKIRYVYSGARYFNNYFGDLEILFKKSNSTKLVEFNLALIEYFRFHLGIKTPLNYSSKIGVSEFKGSDLILEICHFMKADVYLCGSSGRDYLKQDDFKSRGISIEWLDYQCPEYSQLCKTFTPNLSTIDLLFNHGSASVEIIKKNVIEGGINVSIGSE